MIVPHVVLPGFGIVPASARHSCCQLLIALPCYSQELAARLSVLSLPDSRSLDMLHSATRPMAIRSAGIVHPYAIHDPLAIFPAEVAVKVFENIELEELLLSTRLTCRAWNTLLFAHLSHLVVASYYIRVDLGRTRLELPLKLRAKQGHSGELEVYASEKVARRVHEADDVRWFTVSAGIINRDVSRAYMSNHGQPVLHCCGSTAGGQRIYEAQVNEIQYSNPITNTGSLDAIKLNLNIKPIIVADNGSGLDNLPSESRVNIAIDSSELTKWIVLCRLAQGYQTPTEAQELSSPVLKFNGIIAPYIGFKNSGGIWGKSPPRISV